MPILRIGRAIGLLCVVALFTPMVLPVSARLLPHKQAKYEEHPESPEVAAIIDRVVGTERDNNRKLKAYSPRVETYVQFYRPDLDLGDVAWNDAHFLGRLKFGSNSREISFTHQQAALSWLRHRPELLRTHLEIGNFAIDPLEATQENFDRKHYSFTPVHWEYLGDVRCLAIDVHPRGQVGVGAFQGRIWVEDHNDAIVRINGTRVHPPRMRFYVHFDCWRENLQAGVWLPVYIYSQESDLGPRLRYKSETRLWGYDLTARREQQEWTNIQVDAPAPVRDHSESESDLSPVESQRQFTMDAERNVLDRLEKARLIAPPGPIDKVLDTVVNNLRVTNHLDNLPPVECRVELTSTLESFSLAYTIVLSRGLIDVLPDESSLAMILSHELAHIALGHKLDTKYGFNDRLQVSDENLLASLDLARSSKDEAAADAKGLEFLKNSPYKDKLGQAGLFLKAAVAADKHVPNLFGAHLGNGLMEPSKLVRMAGLMTGAPALAPKNVNQTAALPLGSRVQVNAWDGSVAFTTRKTVPIVDASEKLPFRVTPVVPYLRVYSAGPSTEVSAINKSQ